MAADREAHVAVSRLCRGGGHAAYESHREELRGDHCWARHGAVGRRARAQLERVPGEATRKDALDVRGLRAAGVRVRVRVRVSNLAIEPCLAVSPAPHHNVRIHACTEHVRTKAESEHAIVMLWYVMSPCPAATVGHRRPPARRPPLSPRAAAACNRPERTGGCPCCSRAPTHAGTCWHRPQPAVVASSTRRDER